MLIVDYNKRHNLYVIRNLSAKYQLTFIFNEVTDAKDFIDTWHDNQPFIARFRYEYQQRRK